VSGLEDRRLLSNYALTTLASFNFTNGAWPSAGVVLDGQGNLYGTTNIALASDGTVFEIKAGSNTITTLASFNGTNGDAPGAGVVLDGQGNLYGTTEFGGASAEGTVFELKPSNPVIAATTPTWNTTDGGVDYGYTIGSAGLSIATTVDLDWASGTTVDSVIGSPIISTTTATAQGTYQLHATPSQLGTPPAGATYLLVVADPGNLVSPADPSKVASLALTSITATTPTWNTTIGGVDYGYTIGSAGLSQTTTVDLDWASGTTVNTVIGSPITSTTTATAQGTYQLHATPSDLGTPPAGATYLLVVADPGNLVSPADPSKVASLGLIKPTVVVSAMHSDGTLVTDSSPLMMNEPFTVEVTVTNNAPVPESFHIAWQGAASPAGAGLKPDFTLPQDIDTGPIDPGSSATFASPTYFYHWDWIPAQNPLTTDPTTFEQVKSAVKDAIDPFVDTVLEQIEKAHGLVEGSLGVVSMVADFVATKLPDILSL